MVLCHPCICLCAGEEGHISMDEEGRISMAEAVRSCGDCAAGLGYGDGGQFLYGAGDQIRD